MLVAWQWQINLKFKLPTASANEGNTEMEIPMCMCGRWVDAERDRFCVYQMTAATQSAEEEGLEVVVVVEVDNLQTVVQRRRN